MVTSLLPPWEAVAWVAVALFAAAGLVRWRGRPALERPLSSLGWVALAALWVVMLPYFALEAVSPLQTVLVIVAIPASLWAGLVRWRGRAGLVRLGNAAAIAGAIYLPAETFAPIRRTLIETVAGHTHGLMELLGHSPGLVAHPVQGYVSQFDFDGHTTYIVLACTGLGSMAIFAGVLMAADGPLDRRLGASLLLAAVIYVLNLVRNVFVGLATPYGWFGGEPFVAVAGVFGVGEVRASFFVSHTLIAQPLSLVALVVLMLVALRLVPGLFAVLDEVVYVLTGDDVDLRAEFGPALLGEAPEGTREALD